MRKKIISMLLVTAIGAMSLAGCNGGQPTSQESAAQVTAESNKVVKPDNFNKTGYPIVNEPITLKVMWSIRDGDTLMAPQEMPAFKRLEEKTGINIEWEIIKSSDWDTKLNLAFASGEFPDVIINVNNDIDVEEYGVSQKILIPLDDLVEQYMPNYTERIKMEDTDPTVSLKASDGKKYSIGNLMAQSINTQQHFFINQTWLDALNIKTPETFEELTNTLMAFKTDDPNGNDQADEIPVEMGVDVGSYGVRVMLPLFGIPCDGEKWIYIEDDRSVQFVPYKDEFRDCMEWLHMLYQEELLDPEVLSQDSTTIDTKLRAGNIGFFNCWRLTEMGFDDGVMKDSTLFMPAPAGDSKVSLYRYLEMAKRGAYVTSANQHVPATMRWIDELLETETMFSLYYGEQEAEIGSSWFYNEEGKIENIHNGQMEVKNYPGNNTLFFAPGKYTTEVYQWAPHRQEKIEYCELYEAANLIQKYSNDYLDMAPLTAEQIKSNSLKEIDINNAVWENVSDFIQNGVTDDKWSKFINLFDGIGADDYVNMYQEAIDGMEF